VRGNPDAVLADAEEEDACALPPVEHPAREKTVAVAMTMDEILAATERRDVRDVGAVMWTMLKGSSKKI
jgi:hypothetical protein